MRIQGIRRRLYHYTYDKPRLDQKALQLRRSVEEVKKLLGGRTKSAK